MFWKSRRRLSTAATAITAGSLFAAVFCQQPALADTSPIQLTALSSSAVNLQWSIPSQVNRIQIFRAGRLLDDVSVSGGSTLSYTDALLWPSTSYTYDVVGINPGSQIASDQTATVVTLPQTEAFPMLYSSTSFWNAPLPADPAIDPNSDAMVSASLSAYSSSANFNNSNDWGKPLAYANTISEQYSVGCTIYDCGTTVTFRLPRYATPTTGRDHHLIVLDPSSGSELDMFQASYDPTADSWTAASRYVSASNGWGALCSPGEHCLASVAAGFAAFGGVVRPEEIAQGHIDHALFFATPLTRAGFIACPATNTDGWSTDPSALPEGARIQLDPSFNVDAQPWPTWEKLIAHALQTYGAYLGDTGGSVAFAAEANLDRGYDAWSLAGVPDNGPSLANLPWSSFRVLALQSC